MRRWSYRGLSFRIRGFGRSFVHWQKRWKGLRPISAHLSGLFFFKTHHKIVILSVIWACGPPKMMKNVSVPATTLSLPLPSPCHPDRSEAKRRDLRFYGPFLDMFFDGAKRLTDLSPDTRLMARSRRTPTVLVLPMPLRAFQPPKPLPADPPRSFRGAETRNAGILL